MPIIESLLDTDYYKLSQLQCFLHNFPNEVAKYKFQCRNKKIVLDEDINLFHLQNEIENLCHLRFTDKELDYLENFSNFFIPQFSKDFISFLKNFKLDKRYVHVFDENGSLGLYIEGTLLQVMMFEVYILSIINELYFRKKTKGSDEWIVIGEKNLKDKIKLLNKSPEGFTFVEFGTRRRFSLKNQEHIIRSLLYHRCFSGTSNVMFSMKYGRDPKGTQAHESFQASQAVDIRLDHSQKWFLETWIKEFRGKLGIALTDCINMDAFLRDFDCYLANAYLGCRHDSGDPYIWCDRLINHYDKLHIDPKSKMAFFSDGLNIKKAIDLFDFFAYRIGVGFGIGTNLTNDVGFEPLNIVIKMVEYNGMPVAKISDSPGKGMCEDIKYVDYLKKVYGLDK